MSESYRVGQLVVVRDHEIGDEYLARVRAQSAFESDVTLESDAKYIMLSTCAYSFLNARTVLHGKLVPVNSAGGVPFDELDRTT